MRYNEFTINGRRPLVLIYFEAPGGVSATLKREYAIKQLSRQQKELLVKDFQVPSEYTDI